MVVDPKEIGDWLSSEIAVAWHISFWVAVALAGVVIWWFVQREYSTRLANAESTIGMLKERLNRQQQDEAMAIAAQRVESEAPRQLAIPVTLPVDQRHYADITPKALVDAFKGRTSVQAKALVEPHLGKRLRVEGKVIAVNSVYGDKAIVGLRAAGTLFYGVFDHLTPALSGLSIDQKVTIDGKIDEVDSIGVTLVNCALVEAA